MKREKKKILLTSLNSKYIHTNLALQYLYQYTLPLKQDILIREYTINEPMDKILGQIAKEKADMVGFSCYIWNYEETLKLCRLLKLIYPELLIVLGGPEVSFDPQEVLEKYPYIDVVVMGEGEETFHELVSRFGSDSDFGGVLGMAYRKDGMIRVEPKRPLIERLDQIPSMAAFQVEALGKKNIIYYECSRGCPFQCQYCLSSTTHSVRFFSMERIKKDLAVFMEAGVPLIKFVDRTFNCDKYFTLEIFRFIVKHNQKTRFHFEICADLLDEETLDFLKKVPKGMFQFEIGVQSTYLPTLKEIRRVTDLEKLGKTVNILREYGNIHLHLDLIAGLPFEDYNRFQESFNDIFSLRPHALQLGFLKLLKGSGLKEREKQYGYVYSPYAPYEVLKSNEMSYEDLLKLKRVEDVLEKYYNSGRFPYSLPYLMETYFSTPFSFFDRLSLYFEEKGYDKVSHSPMGLFQILLMFFTEKCAPEDSIFLERLKADMLLFNKDLDLPAYLKKDMEADKKRYFDFLKEEKNIKKYLRHYEGLTAKEIYKKIRIEPFSIAILEGNREEEVFYLFDQGVIQKIRL